MSREILEFLVTSSRHHPPDGHFMMELAKMLESMDGRQDIGASIELLEKLIRQKEQRQTGPDYLEQNAMNLLRAICTCWKCKQLIESDENDPHPI